jgi:hypothetical protein
MRQAPQKYRITSWKIYSETLEARGSQLIWLDLAMSWYDPKRQARAQPDTQRRGDPVLPEYQVPLQSTAAPDHGDNTRHKACCALLDLTTIGATGKYSTRNKCEFWQTEPDAVQGGECAAVRALQAGANAATRRLWQPETHLFQGEYLDR